VEDVSLFRGLFNPILSDRRMDGDLFMPPDPAPEYIETLRALVAEEKAVRERQKEHFLSTAFEREAPGPLFPSSWVPPTGISNGQVARELHPRVDYGARLEQMLKTMTPVFSKAAEDGTKFRIYEVGSLEVRTIQEHDGKERIGVVFSSRVQGSAKSSTGDLANEQDETITRATQFVEASQQTKESKRPPADIRFYVVFETSVGDFIVTEKVGDQATWVRNPEDLEARNSFAKVTRSTDCSNLGLAVLNAKRRREAEHGRFSTAAEGVRYAEEMYALALAA